MAYDESLYLSIKDVLKGIPGVEEKKMFGSVAFLKDGNMFCGPIDSRLMVRVGKEAYENALKEPHVTKMDFTGRELKGFIYVKLEGLVTQNDVRKWIRKGLNFVETLPRK
jgi:TfoX/Sxy family transcriptional regulator of competence genes